MMPDQRLSYGKKKIISDNTLAWLMSGLFGIFSGLFLVFGYQLEKYDHIVLDDSNALGIMVCIMAVLTFDVKHIWDAYLRTYQGKKFLGFIDLNAYREKRSKEVVGISFFRDWIILILLYIPVLLAENPGFFVYDAQSELNEVLTRSFSTHHPLLHVLLLGGTIALVHKLTGSFNAGIFVYSFCQMLVITAIFAYVITYLKKKRVGKKVSIFWMLFYGLFPTVVMFVLCSSKDGLFSAFLLLLTAFLLEMTEDVKAFLSDRKKTVFFVIAATLMPCFRHNGFYAYLVFVPFAFIYFRKELKSILPLILVLPVALYLLISTALSGMLSNEGAHHQEMLTVPIMQLVRVYSYEKDTMTLEEIETLQSFIPSENLELYTPRVSDMVKAGFNNDLYEQDSKAFWDLWWKLFTKHPMTYLNAWLLTSYGYWYPPALINVYKGNEVFTFTYDESSYFGYEVELPGTRHSLIPVIDEFYRYISIGSFHKDVPILALLFSPGMMLVVYLFMMLYRLSVRNYAGVLSFLPIILTWLTVILGPTYLVRYVVYLWFALPLLFVKSGTVCTKKDKKQA